MSVPISRRLAPVVCLLTVGLAACGGESAPAPGAERSVDPTTTVAAEPVAAPPVAETGADGEIADGSAEVDEASPDPAGVVAAMILVVSGGDLDGAVGAGIVTEAEAEAAVAALESGDPEIVLAG